MLTVTALKRALFCGTAGAAMMIAGVAHAQTAPADPPAEAAAASQDTDSEEVVVTGSRVVRDGFKAPTPLVVLTQKDIQNTSPSNNIADFVNQQPALAGSTRPSNSRLNLSSGQAGINTLNLRNLDGSATGTRTLVLLDGRRSVPSAITGTVDVNTIPQALIKSVEIVTGGASAAYGSDAVAGVVNFILDKKYKGLKVSADSGISTYGDGYNYSMNVTGGMSFGGGRGHILLSGEVAHRDGIFTVDRAWNATGYVRIQNPAFDAVTNQGVPQFLIRRQVGAANSTPGGLITGSAIPNPAWTPGAPSTIPRTLPTTRLRGTYFGSGGQALQYQYGALTFPSPTGTNPPTLTQGGSWQVNDSGRRIGLDPQDDRHGLFGRLSYEISDGVELFAEAAYNKQRVFFNAGPNLSTGIALDARGCGAAATAAAAPTTCNAFLYNALGPTALVGLDSVTVATTAADLPFRAVDNRREVQRYTIGAEGNLNLFGKAAPWNVYGQYGRAELREQLRNIMNTARVNNATAAVFAPAGNPGGYAAGSIQCLINVDASTTNDDRACVPLNRLGLGVTNPAAISYILGAPYREEVLEQYVTGANLSLTPFATWAGDVSIAIGGEYREEKIKGFVPSQFQPLVTPNPAGGITTANTWSVGNYLPTNGKFNVKEAYLETVVPLGLGIEFNGAVRATDYSTSGYVTTWKAGATWQVNDDVRFRVTRSRDIRAPNLNELYAAGSSNSDSVRNPYAPGAGPGTVTYPASISYSATVTGNLDLTPEKADSWNVGAVFSPTFIPGLNVSADYFRIEIKDAIGSLSAQEIINRCFEGNSEFCTAISPDPNNATRILFRSQPFNFANVVTRGFDFDASYRLPINRLFENADGAFTLRGVATYYLDNVTDQGIANTPIFDTVGVNGGQATTPKWIYRINATYDTPTFSITGTARGISSGKYVAAAIECATNCPTGRTPTQISQVPTYDENHVKGLFYVDLNLTQKVKFDNNAEGQLFFNVTNVFNKGPLLLPETGLAANSTYSDLLGRQFRVGFRMETK